jgi:hypothetical protein
VAGSPTSDREREAEEQQHDDEVDDVGEEDGAIRVARDGDATHGAVERVDRGVAAGPHHGEHDESDPWHPDEPLHQVSSTAYPATVDSQQRLLESGRGAHPAAPQATEDERADEHRREDDEAAVHDAVEGAVDDQVGRQVVHRDREGDEREQE